MTDLPLTVLGPLQLPPQPNVTSFMYDEGVNHIAYNAALKAWEKVCKQLIDAHAETVRSVDFWKGPR